jgi:short-subunit dehydrogenase
MKQSLHVWVTGASRGIGAAIAQALAADGHRISLSGRNQARLTDVANGLPSASTAVVPCDVANEQSVQRAYDLVVGGLGPVDVLINNAGSGQWADMTDLSIEAFDDQLAVNLRGVFLCCRTVVPAMVAAGAGHIITINSVAAITTFSGNTAYAASKAGALALTRSLREEVRSSGIKVTDLLVGATETDIWPHEARHLHADRMMQATDIGTVVRSAVALGQLPAVHLEEMIVRPQLGDL